MGDVIKKLKVRGLNEDELNLYFDTGSPFTFIRKSVAKRLGGMLSLPKPCEFGGLGDGKFMSKEIMVVEVKLLDIWCVQEVFVVEDKEIPRGDMLVGHDFMQRYGIKLDLKKCEIILDREALISGKIIKKEALW